MPVAVFSPHELVSSIEFTGNTPQWGTSAASGAPSISSRQPAAELILPLSRRALPSVVAITRVRVIVNPIAAHATPTDRMRVRLLEEAGYNFAAGTSSGGTTHVDQRDDGTANQQVVDSGAIDVPIPAVPASLVRVQITSSASVVGATTFAGAGGSGGSGTLVPDVIAWTGLSEVVDNPDTTYCVAVTGPASEGADDRLYGVEVAFNDPGPRNY